MYDGTTQTCIDLRKEQSADFFFLSGGRGGGGGWWWTLYHHGKESHNWGDTLNQKGTIYPRK